MNKDEVEVAPAQNTSIISGRNPHNPNIKVPGAPAGGSVLGNVLHSAYNGLTHIGHAVNNVEQAGINAVGRAASYLGKVVTGNAVNNPPSKNYPGAPIEQQPKMPKMPKTNPSEYRYTNIID